ncbi:MAG: 3TM-type holin [Caulobacteraceae bacterium]
MFLDPVAAALDLGGKLIDRLIPDPAQKQAAALELLKLQQSGELAQLTADTELAKGQLVVNQTEATNANLFVSGWRPFVGWVSGFGLAYAFLVRPIASPWAQKNLGFPMEALDMGTLGTLLFGMLGLGGMRTVEKINGVAAK